MHITGGKLRRRAIKTVQKRSVPPRQKSVVFSMIGHDLTGCLLDAFGGSNMGLEAWSRGASPVLITEKTTVRLQIRRHGSFEASVSVQRIDAAKGIVGDWDTIF